MQIKNTLSLFMALLMFTRVIAFDGQLLNVVTEPGELVLVKQSCKMKNFTSSSPVKTDISEDAPSGLHIEYLSFCNSYFQFDIAKPFETFSMTAFHEFTSPVLNFPSAERQITSPPPKVVL